MRAALCLLLVLLAARADEETARYFVQRGEKALEEGDLAQAEKFFRRSLDEKDAYAPAFVGLAGVAKQRGDRTEAIKMLDLCLAQKRNVLSAPERQAIDAAEAMLAELDKARAGYRKLVDAHVAKVLSLAARTKDRELAAECYRTVLLLRPDHPVASRELKSLGSGESVAPGGTPLFNGRDLSGWTGEGPVWYVRRGNMIGKIEDAARINRVREQVRGDFTLDCEMRVLADIGQSPLFGILFGMRGSYDHVGLWLWQDSWRLEHQTSEHDRAELHHRAFKRYKGKFNRRDWNTYRIEVKGKRVTGYVNGQKVWSTSGTPRPLDGHVGLWVQEMSVEIRKLILIN